MRTTYIGMGASIAVISMIAVGCGSSNGSSVSNVSSDVSFTGIAVPEGDSQKELRSTTEVSVGGETQAISFTKLLATGDSNNNEIFGLVKDHHDTPITFDDGSPYICNGTNSGVGSGLDHSSILQKNGKLYMVSQFECQVGAMYKVELEQDAATGTLSVKENSMEFVSQKEGFGGFVHCAGQTTPWNSHLGSEEYEIDARAVEKDINASTGLVVSGAWDGEEVYYNEVAKFWGNDATRMSPYYYGWTPEVTIDANGNALYAKHYAMGRFSHELSFVMPDKKTVYMSDDGTNVGLFMFKADNAEELGAGTLYAAKWTQTSQANGGSANISWIKLAHATDSEIKAILDPDGDVETNDAPLFSDLFDSADGNSTTGECPSGYTAVNASAYFECLKVKSGMEQAAALLETRRYAALVGATTEFRKEEGITYDAANNKLYIAMSEVARGMEDHKKNGEANSKYDIGGNNDVKLDYNPCGALYALDVDGNYTATTMSAVLNGKAIDEDSDGNTCDLENISNPDNLTFLEGTDLLFIGEDSSMHKNNMVWSYNVKTQELTRLLTTPLDAETTSIFWHKNINGYSYMTAVTQHPMEKVEGASNDEKESFVGVLGPITGIK